jgi:predicted transcriptional regulator
MRSKVIDDDKLMEMVHKGIPQKDIARELGVSAPAICKRLKKLIPAPDLSKYGLTARQINFVKAKASGKTNTQAVLDSYETGSMESAKSIGTKLMDSPEVNLAIKELMDYHGLTRSHRISRLKQHIDNRDPNVSLRGLDLSFRLDGYPSNNVNVQMNSLSMLIRAAHESPKVINDDSNNDLKKDGD